MVQEVGDVKSRPEEDHVKLSLHLLPGGFVGRNNALFRVLDQVLSDDFAIGLGKTGIKVIQEERAFAQI